MSPLVVFTLAFMVAVTIALPQANLDEPEKREVDNQFTGDASGDFLKTIRNSDFKRAIAVPPPENDDPGDDDTTEEEEDTPATKETRLRIKGPNDSDIMLRMRVPEDMCVNAKVMFQSEDEC